MIGRSDVGVVDSDRPEEGRRAVCVDRLSSSAVELNSHGLSHPVVTAFDANTVDHSSRAVFEGEICGDLRRGHATGRVEKTTDSRRTSDDSRAISNDDVFIVVVVVRITAIVGRVGHSDQGEEAERYSSESEQAAEVKHG